MLSVMPVATNQITSNLLYEIEKDVLWQLRGQIQKLQLEIHDGGLILKGRAYSFYGKQLVLHAVKKRTEIPVVGNRVEVR